MLKIILIFGIAFYLYRLFGRESNMATRKSTPFTQPNPQPKTHELIEDAEIIEKNRV